MKKQLGLAVAISCVSTQINAADDLYFSEYIEGSGNNKALEIFNDTGADIDLSAYEVQMYFNGNTNAGLTLPLSGSLARGEVYVLAQSAADAAVANEADQLSSASWFNGDDAIVLVSGGETIDVIGQLGVDPGSQWGTGLASTQNSTLRRKPGASADSNVFDVFDPELGWDGFEQNTFDNLGKVSAVILDPDDADPQMACGEAATFIHDIQGSGNSSPLVGSQQSIEAVVVGGFQGSDQLKGFYLQEEDSDIDGHNNTSEGIFVYGSIDGISEGDLLRITGTVTEFHGMTQLNNISGAETCDSGLQVTAAEIILPLQDQNELEKFEAMLVVLPQNLTVSENYNLGRYGELILSHGRLAIPTNVVSPGEAAIEKQRLNNNNKIILDDGSRRQNPHNINYPAPGLSATNVVRGGDTVTGVTGVLEYAFGAYRVHPLEIPTFLATNERTDQLELPGVGTLKVASFNVLNFFNGDGQGGGFPTARGADTFEELQRQGYKLVSALMALDADIIGLMEIENDGYGEYSAIGDLVNALNTAGGDYAFVNPGVTTLGEDAIAVGLIYKASSVELVGETKILDASIDDRFIDDKNRPVLIQSFRELDSDEVLTVAVNHLKSKGSDCNELGDPDTGDGQGNCNLTRTRAAQALVDYLSLDPTGSGDTDRLIMGDLNAYAKEDPVTAIKASGYSNLIEQHLGEGAYSYVFYGQAGYLDHALASHSLSAQVSGVNIWSINADEPRVLDYNTEYKSDSQLFDLYETGPYRASDHDPVVIEIALDSEDSKAGDFNQNGFYDMGDFFKLLNHWGCEIATCAEYDLNHDNSVNFRDIRQWFRLISEER